MFRIFKNNVAEFAKGLVIGSSVEYLRQLILMMKATKDREVILKSYRNYENDTRAFYKDSITEYNFLQGMLGNCGMIASMATLASNIELYNKVVPSGQNFQINSKSYTSDSSEFVFYLYKFGKLYKVVVDKTLPTDEKGLFYSRSYNENLVGPFLEKALIALHFDGKYESARSVKGENVLTSISNNLFEKYRILPTILNNYSELKVDDVIDHGLKTKSPMVVGFYRDISKYGLNGMHYYCLVDKKDNQVKLYDPHGFSVSLPKKVFSDNLYTLENILF